MELTTYLRYLIKLVENKKKIKLAKILTKYSRSWEDEGYVKARVW